MRDLGTTALSDTITLLAVYAAGLIFVAQHVADRYSPRLYPIVVRRTGSLWLGILALLAFGALVLALLPFSRAANMGDASLVAAALITAVLGLFFTFKAAANREAILDMVSDLREPGRLQALRDLSWNAASRGDVTATEHILGLTDFGSEEHAAILGWLTQYPQLLSQPWLTTLVMDRLTAGTLDGESTDRLEPAFRRLLQHSLDRGMLVEARDIVFRTMRALGKAGPFGAAHESLAFEIGFHAHFAGEEARAVRRRAETGLMLQDVQDCFVSELTPLRRSILAYGRAPSLTWFARLLERLGQSRIGRLHILGNVYDVLEDGYAAGILTTEALEALAVALNTTRYEGDGNPTDRPDPSDADELAAHLGLYVVLLGDHDQLRRILGNAGYRPGKTMPRRLTADPDIGEETYSAVAQLLGVGSWSAN